VVVVGLHGMNDYANVFHLSGPYWAKHGISTYAFDQRGFGRSPVRGVWAGEPAMAQDLRTFVPLIRKKFPNATVAVVGESMGAAVAISAFASDDPPQADRLVLIAPAVWGWSSQPPAYRAALRVAARVFPDEVLEPPGFITRKVRATDNTAELIAMGKDPLVIWGSRTQTLYGLVSLMESAWASTGRIKVPTLYMYGAHDMVIPKKPACEAASRLGSNGRTAYYANGWHMLLRDLQAKVIWRDAESFIRDPAAPLPSGAPPIPTPCPTRVVRTPAGG
jgi:alpha-beta hydrolase superfamily lysophospholipase